MSIKVTRAGFESYWVNRHRRLRRLAKGVATLFDLRVNGQPVFVNDQQLKATGNGN